MLVLVRQTNGINSWINPRAVNYVRPVVDATGQNLASVHCEVGVEGGRVFMLAEDGLQFTERLERERIAHDEAERIRQSRFRVPPAPKTPPAGVLTKAKSQVPTVEPRMAEVPPGPPNPPRPPTPREVG